MKSVDVLRSCCNLSHCCVVPSRPPIKVLVGGEETNGVVEGSRRLRVLCVLCVSTDTSQSARHAAPPSRRGGIGASPPSRRPAGDTLSLQVARRRRCGEFTHLVHILYISTAVHPSLVFVRGSTSIDQSARARPAAGTSDNHQDDAHIHSRVVFVYSTYSLRVLQRKTTIMSNHGDILNEHEVHQAPSSLQIDLCSLGGDRQTGRWGLLRADAHSLPKVGYCGRCVWSGGRIQINQGRKK